MTQRTDRHDPRLSVKAGRALRRQTQSELADALTEATGEKWTRVMVGKLETGGKVLDVETLQAIAEIQRLPYSFYLEAPGSRATGVYRSSRLPVPAAAF